jgi:hypothetical protein
MVQRSSPHLPRPQDQINSHAADNAWVDHVSGTWRGPTADIRGAIQHHVARPTPRSRTNVSAGQQRYAGVAFGTLDSCGRSPPQVTFTSAPVVCLATDIVVMPQVREHREPRRHVTPMRTGLRPSADPCLPSCTAGGAGRAESASHPWLVRDLVAAVLAPPRRTAGLRSRRPSAPDAQGCAVAEPHAQQEAGQRQVSGEDTYTFLAASADRCTDLFVWATPPG